MFPCLLIISFFILTGCEQKPQVRQYTEVIVPAPLAQMPPMAMKADPHAGMDMSVPPEMMPTVNSDLKLAWDLPKGWAEKPGKGMRLASFYLVDNPQEIDVSIVSLGGMAGGLEANLQRWLGQINVQVSDVQMQEFIQASQDNIFDFTQLQKGADSLSKSTIAAMITLGDTTVFVKMTGSIKAVGTYKKDFIALVKSVRAK